MKTPLLQLRDISKSFGPVIANQHIHFEVAAGEVHALAGENGAGKSTLMNILYGLYQPDTGEIRYKGELLRHHSPRRAIELGIGMIHQHFMLIPTLTVAENLVLGQEPRKGLRVDREAAAAAVRELGRRYGLELDPLARVGALSVGEQQRVEILKVLYRGAELLILDEPTAVLTPGEVQAFFAVLRKLVAQGKTVILISHKLDELIGIADQITIIRRGQTVASADPKQTTPQELANLMVGRPVRLQLDKAPVVAGAPVLQMCDLNVDYADGRLALENCSFQIQAGEIFGVAGVEGSGQRELIEAIMGLHRERIRGGDILLDGHSLLSQSTRQRLEAGISHIPEDRHHRGLVLDFSLAENLILGQQQHFSPRGLLQLKRIQGHAQERIAAFDIRPPVPELAARGLSGGNQQKIVVAREFERPFKLLIAAQPTRGVDVGAIELIHARILEARAAGQAVLLLSAELSEILNLSDRVGVLFKGRLVQTLTTADTTAQDLGRLMTGAGAP
ncbi:MAG: ABC transporter ATP-binding protein [Candidatus Sericytochromatia bacterium]